MAHFVFALITLFCLVNPPAEASPKRCGYWLGKERTFVRYVHQSAELEIFGLNQDDHPTRTSLELYTPNPGHKEIRFVEDPIEVKDHDHPYKNLSDLRQVYAREFRVRALLLGAVLRKYKKADVTFGFHWQSDQLNWREFEIAHRREAERIYKEGAPLRTRGAWMTEFMRRRGFTKEVVTEARLPDFETEAFEIVPSFDHYSLNVVRGKGWKVHSIFSRAKRRPGVGSPN